MPRPGPIRWARTHPDAGDVLFGVLLTGIALAIHLTGGHADSSTGEPTWWRALLVVAATAPICMRRRWPWPVAITVSVAQMVCELTHTQGTGWLGVLVAAYTVGAYTDHRHRHRSASIAAAGAGIGGFLLLGVAHDRLPAWQFVDMVVVLIVAFVIGDNVRRRRERISDLAERAERAERERDLVARQRVTEERTRIARELHDVVAHSVSVMVIQAAAARRQIDRDPQAAADALAAIEVSGRGAMDEMRRILGVLRTDATDPREPVPGLDDLADLVADDPTLPVELAVDGDFGAVPGSTQLAAYRVVQEALTNVRKHAGRVNKVRVQASCDARTLIVAVSDDGRGAAAPRERDAAGGDAGFGLVGMRERVAIANGRLDAGPSRSGGWNVRASFDLTDAAR